MISVRAATEQDAGDISHVHIESWRTTYKGIVPQTYLDALNETERVPLWREWLGRDIKVFVAHAKGEIVGFIAGGPIREPLRDFDAELFAIYVLKQNQRSHVGTSLLRALTVSLREEGFRSMAVWVLESNSSGRFYERSGAVPAGSKEIEVGGAMLPATAYGWSDLGTIFSP